MAQSINDLNDWVQRARNALESHFAEIRTNILLDAGNHHPKRERLSQTRVFRDASRQKKIRITKNHIQVITKFIRNSIQNRAPDGGVYPVNEKELADRKAAELNSSVYEWLKTESQLSSVYGKIIHDFVVQGETYTKVFWDPEGGGFAGWEEAEGDDADAYGSEPNEENEDEEDEEDSDEEKEPREEEEKKGGTRKPKFKGGIVYETIPAYNFLTDPNATSERTNEHVCIIKYIPRKKLLDRYRGDEKKFKIVKNSSRERNNWFDGFTGIYTDSGSDEVELREHYFKPGCPDYPEGGYCFTTDTGILEKGDLPDGFCIFSAVFDEAPETPRGYAIVKQAKSFQTEVNRCAAAIIMESIVLGHSTVLYQAGQKPSTSAIGNGMKGLEYHSLAAPVVVEGKSGEQYVDYMNSMIDEMYKVCLVPQQDEDKQPAQGNDAQAMLGRALKDKMRFSLYGEKIELLICSIIDYSLALARRYMSDDQVIPIIGKSEAVNIAEFKNTTPRQYQIKIKPRSDDFTSVYGKSIQIIQALQYVGNQLPPEAIAGMIRELPFVNKETMLKDFTVWQDQADAVILSLDRGQQPFFFERTNHDYMIQRLSMRMNENDFPDLAPEIQMNYLDRYDAHVQVMSQQQKEAAEADAGFIPSQGGLVSVDYYIQTAEGKQQRARLPYEAVHWLIERLRQQGTEVEKITNLPPAAQADLGRMNMQQGVANQLPAPSPGGMAA